MKLILYKKCFGVLTTTDLTTRKVSLNKVEVTSACEIFSRWVILKCLSQQTYSKPVCFLLNSPAAL